MPPKRRSAAEGKEAASSTSPQKRAKSGQAAGAEDSDAGPRYFLMKSEPHEFSVDELAGCPDQTHCWDGVRNYQARNIMRDRMRVGDQAFFYHSNCKLPGVVGIMEVVKLAYPDHTQFDKNHKGYDASSSEDKPRWLMVDVKLKSKLKGIVSLPELRKHADGALKDMVLLNNSRLSVQPVTKEQWDFILSLEPES